MRAYLRHKWIPVNKVTTLRIVAISLNFTAYGYENVKKLIVIVHQLYFINRFIKFEEIASFIQV